MELHPTFYVELLKKYRLAMCHGLVSLPNAKSHKLIALPAVLDALMTSVDIALSSAHFQEFSAPGFSTIRAARGSTAESFSHFSLPSWHSHEQPHLLAGRQPPCSQLHKRHPRQPGRPFYVLQGPPPLVDAEGQVSWVVDYIVVHEDPHSEVTLMAREMRAHPSARKYRVRWLGFPL